MVFLWWNLKLNIILNTFFLFIFVFFCPNLKLGSEKLTEKVKLHFLNFLVLELLI